MQRQTARNTPFFLMISHYAVHTRIQAKPETLKAYENRESGKQHTNSGYAAMTENLDESLNTIMQTLDELNLTDHTYLFYTSDNGGEIGSGNTPTNNTPLRKGKTHTWEGGIRVPLIVKGPGIEPNSQSDVAVNGSDFFSTFMDLIGIDEKQPENLDGGSLAGLLKNGGKGKVDRGVDHFVWYYPHYRNFKGVLPQAAIRVGDYKLRKEYETDKLYLFDLSRDISETNDLSESEPELTAKLHKQLNDYLADIGAKVPTKNLDYDVKLDTGLTARFNFGRPQGGRPQGQRPQN